LLYHYCCGTVVALALLQWLHVEDAVLISTVLSLDTPKRADREERPMMALEDGAVVGMLFEEEGIVAVGISPDDLAVMIHAQIMTMMRPELHLMAQLFLEPQRVFSMPMLLAGRLSVHIGEIVGIVDEHVLAERLLLLLDDNRVWGGCVHWLVHRLLHDHCRRVGSRTAGNLDMEDTMLVHGVLGLQAAKGANRQISSMVGAEGVAVVVALLGEQRVRFVGLDPMRMSMVVHAQI